MESNLTFSCALLLFQSMESVTLLDGKYITRRRRGVIGAGTAPILVSRFSPRLARTFCLSGVLPSAAM